MRENISVYYDKRKHGDLKGMLGRLGRAKNSLFFDRSESEIARILLEKALKRLTRRGSQVNMDGGEE